MQEYNAKIEKDGTLHLPPDVLEKIGVQSNSPAVLCYDGTTLTIQSAVTYYLSKFQEALYKEVGKYGWSEAIKFFIPYIKQKNSISGDLMNELRKKMNESLFDILSALKHRRF